MKDPNLKKIIKANLKEIAKDQLGTAITHASSYLYYIYINEDKKKRKIELDNFIEEIKILSNELRINENSNGENNVKSKKQQKNKYRKKGKCL